MNATSHPSPGLVSNSYYYFSIRLTGKTNPQSSVRLHTFKPNSKSTEPTSFGDFFYSFIDGLIKVCE